jgi:hypothetical protein
MPDVDGLWQDVFDIKTDYMNALQKNHKAACKSLPKDEHLDDRNMSKTL